MASQENHDPDQKRGNHGNPHVAQPFVGEHVLHLRLHGLRPRKIGQSDGRRRVQYQQCQGNPGVRRHRPERPPRAGSDALRSDAIVQPPQRQPAPQPEEAGQCDRQCRHGDRGNVGAQPRIDEGRVRSRE